MFTVPNVPENTVLVRFDVLFAYIFEAVTGGKGVVQLKIATAKNETITAIPEDETAGDDSAAPADAALAAPAPAPAAAPAAAETEGDALEPAAAAAAAPRSPAGKGKLMAGKGGG